MTSRLDHTKRASNRTRAHTGVREGLWDINFSFFLLLLLHRAPSDSHVRARKKNRHSLREVKVVELRRGGPAVWTLHRSRTGVYCTQREWKQQANELIANKWSRVSSFVCASCITLVLVCLYYVSNYVCEVTLGFGKELRTIFYFFSGLCKVMSLILLMNLQ